MKVVYKGCLGYFGYERKDMTTELFFLVRRNC